MLNALNKLSCDTEVASMPRVTEGSGQAAGEGSGQGGSPKAETKLGRGLPSLQREGHRAGKLPEAAVQRVTEQKGA